MNNTLENRKKRVLIHLHVYYTEQLKAFLKRIKAICELADIRLFVTISESANDLSHAKEILKDMYKDAILLEVSNRGFDVAPFIEVLHQVDLSDYDYVIKLHTKSRGKQGNTILNGVIISNSVWENIMVDSLIGSKQRFSMALEAMENEENGMAAAGLCLIKDDESRKNYYFWRVNDELEKMGLPLLKDEEDLIFPAGTMFIIRADLLKPLTIYKTEDFGIIFPGIHDYTLAHVFERLFAGLVYANGLKAERLQSRRYRLELRRVEKRYERQEKKKIGESFFDNAGLFLKRLRYKIASRIAKERIIANSKYFDKEWYIRKHPEILKNNENPIRHYLKHGLEYGYNPSAKFNGHEYLRRYPDLLDKKMNPLLHYECYGKFEHRNFFDNSFKWYSQVDCIRHSKYFDEEWYLKNYPDVKNADIDPALHYFQYGGFEGRDPSQLFCTDEYLSIHRDVKTAGINPLFHYEYDGYIQGRELSALELKKPVFDQRAGSFERTYEKAKPHHKRTVLLASFSYDGRIDDSLIYLLKGLKKIADNIVLIADSPIFEEELDKLDGLVSYARYKRHGAYDFGSYRDGLKYLRENGYLDESVSEELVMMNDSCYGPVYPFEESFEKMAKEAWNFWGYVGNWSISFHICSFFYVFDRKVIDSMLLDEFMERVKGEVDRYTAIAEFETQLTKVLTSQNMVAKAYVSETEDSGINHRNILTLLRDYRLPLIKKKSLNGDAKESIVAAMKIIERDNPDLYPLIKISPINTDHHPIDLKMYLEQMPSNIERIRNKIRNKKKVKTYFLVCDNSMFPAKPLFRRMSEDVLFDTKIIVIPDNRISDPHQLMNKCREELQKEFGDEKTAMAVKDRYGRWSDEIDDADIVVFPSPYNVSVYKYNVRYCLGRSFLPLIVNYGYYRSIYDRQIMASFNYAYFWKVFIENEDVMKEYEEYSYRKGENGELTGYIKMDDMADVKEETRKRKRILLALHHSVDGGYNNILSLANFVRYYEYFESLPDRYPQIDFIYRPHPFLFESLRMAKGWDEHKRDEYIRKMKAKPNVIWSDQGNYFKEFVNSDACIQDCGSFLVEYMYTGKPCCYMLKSEEDIERKFAPLGKKCLEQCYISYTTKQIDDFIENVVVKGNDDKMEGRKEFMSQVMVNYPHAADKALELIKKELLEGENG